MTEDEAKTKPCIGPAPHNTGWPGNPDAQGIIIMFCRGSDCLAWRPKLKEYVTGSVPPRYAESGYCGLAGKP